MASEVAQVAGFKFEKTTSLNISITDAISKANTSSSLLENVLEMQDPKQIATNEIAKDSYKECLQLKEYLGEHLWSVSDTDGIADIQNAIDILTRATVSYEMMKDAAEGDWELVDVDIPCL
ncbi:hypothetical protein BJ944DRAFT_262706 [Cunninghamella echinulata]|nr:hypothetical protein BJ944DRAFT_262706 [Cunninghamella echinulata]